MLLKLRGATQSSHLWLDSDCTIIQQLQKEVSHDNWLVYALIQISLAWRNSPVYQKEIFWYKYVQWRHLEECQRCDQTVAHHLKFNFLSKYDAVFSLLSIDFFVTFPQKFPYLYSTQKNGRNEVGKQEVGMESIAPERLAKNAVWKKFRFRRDHV